MLWVMAAALICGLNVLPIDNQERQAFEAALSRALDEASKDVRLEKGSEVLQGLTDIVTSLDEEALKELRDEVIQTVLLNADNVFFENLSDEENAVVHKCLVERFAMTEEEYSELVGFLMLDAYKVFGHLKVTFKDGKSTLSESDDFVVENIDKDGRSTSLTIKFTDVNDGVRFFVTRVQDITPICIQFPKQVEIMLKTADGLEMPGTLDLSSKSPFQYISVMGDEWHAAFSLTPNFDGHHDIYDVTFDHSTENVLNVDMDVILDGVEKLNFTARGAHDLDIDIKKLNSLNSESSFVDFLSVFDGGVVDELQAVINNEIVVKGKINDFSTCMKAEQMNASMDVGYSLKGHTTAASCNLVTYRVSPDAEEYLPYVALQFPGEPAPMVAYDRMSEQDKANYRLLHNHINALGMGVKDLLSALREKIQIISSLDDMI